MITQRATVEVLHSTDPFTDRGEPISGPEVRVCEPTDSAVVLGSRQTVEIVDADACAAAGFGVVRRRSGGGAVLVQCGRVVWIDVVAPHGVGPDDVRGSMQWIGGCWADALTDLVDGRVSVHGGGLVSNEWSEVACFAGVGPGEVLVDGRKLVGLSQRRTRSGIRVQGMVHLSPVMARLCAVLREPLPAGRPDEPYVLPVVPVESIARRIAAALDRPPRR
ncbi:MAG: lipoate--protein ligase family protein [Ilumatobacteraceae bacterium]